MPLNVGDEQANSGLSGAIYKSIDAVLRPSMEKQPGITPETIKQSQEAWKKLSFAIAQGVVTYLKRDPTSKPEFAEVFSSDQEDPVMWNWLNGLTERLNTWASDPASNVTDLKTSLKTFLSTQSIPKQIKGVIR